MKKAIYIPIVIIIIIETIIISLGYICGYDTGKKTGHELGYSVGYFDAKEMYEHEFEELSKQYEELALKNLPSNPDYYYTEAYIIYQDESPDGMIVVAWCVNYSGTQCFLTYEPDYLDEDYTYLLTMYSNGTEDILDDEVAVIWRSIT